MSVFESITHSEEIQELLNDAQLKYDDANKRLESQKKNTTSSLEKLGEEKVHAWSRDMNKFLDSFGSFNNIQMVCKIDDNYEFLGKNETPGELIFNMQNATYNANEIIKAGALSVGTGALVGIATYGGVAMFANASTGTAIAALRGAAKKNATLAWLGGGSLATGGAGIAGGTVVLGGVVIGAIALVGGVIAGARGKAKLAEARKVHADAEAAVSKINVVITGMEGIESVSENYRNFIIRLSRLFTPYLLDMDRIASKYPKGADGKVDYNDLSEMEQKTLHLSWLLAQLYYHILSVPLLNEQGEVEPSSRQLLQKAELDYAQLSGQVTELENEKKKINEYLSGARNSFTVSANSFYERKKATTDALITIGKKRIDFWENAFTPFMEKLSYFENISVSNTYPYSVTSIPIEFIFESSENVLSYIKRLKINGINQLSNTGFVEVALFGGEDFLGELAQLGDDSNAEASVHRHDMSLWFTGKLDPSIADNVSFGEVSEYYISTVAQTIDGISGRENLAQASAIYEEAGILSNKINKAIADFDEITNKIKSMEVALKKYNKIQTHFLKEMDKIRENHQLSGGVVQYDLLSEAEKRVFEMSFVIAKIQYTILASCILKQSNGGDVDETDLVISTANEAYNSIMRDTFNMNEEDDIKTANILWKENADKTKIVGFATSAFCIVLMIIQLMSNNLMGLTGLGGAALAFPVFFCFRDLSQSRLFKWRSVRIIVAVVVVLIAELIGLVV